VAQRVPVEASWSLASERWIHYTDLHATQDSTRLMTAVDEFKAAQERLLRRHGVDAESQFVEVAAVEGPAHVLCSGTGAPVVMLPGYGDPAAMWAPLMAGLDGFTLYAVDRPCFGLTGSAKHTTATFRRLAVVFLEQVLDALKIEQPLFISNSIGSLWTSWFALDRPDRVAAMVHVGCPAFWLGTSAPLPLRLLSLPLIGRFIMAISPPSPRQVEAFGRRMGGEDLSQCPELRDLLVAALKLPNAQRSILELLHAVIRLRGARPGMALMREDLAQIRQPVLLIWGARDAFGGSRVGEEAARVIPNAVLHIVPGGGHVPWVGHPSEVGAAAMPFLRSHATR
jgi:pimeloyl-ACP methyl ester carboxylesterase